MTPKAKSLLQLCWSEPCISLGIAGAASDGMPGTAAQGGRPSLQGAYGHCQPGGHAYMGFAIWEGLPAAARGLGRGHCSVEKPPQLQPSWVSRASASQAGRCLNRSQ